MFSNKLSAIKTILFSTIIVSLFLLFGGCRSTSQTEQDSTTQINPAPQPQPAVLADGSRTSYADIVERVSPAVVNINIEHRTKVNQRQKSPLDDFFRNTPLDPQNQRPQIERGLGSGVIVSADGTILTNNHVIEGADKIKVELNDKRSFDAKVIGTDEPSDLAVLKIDAQSLPYLTLGNSDQVRIGDIVLAIGNPLGIGQTVTQGIISAKGRRTGLSDGSFEDFLQTDAPINRGNSGGALINLNGELIGINSQILSPSGGSIGIGFSIPSNMAKSVLEQILKNGRVRRGQLGVVIQNLTEDLAKTLGLKDTRGVLISEVKPGSAADKAGIKRSDVITAINGEKIEDSNVLRNKIAVTEPGSEITLTILRDGKEQEVKATLDELTAENSTNKKPSDRSDSENPGQGGKLGLTLQPITPDLARQLNLSAGTKGLVITDVDPTGPAAEAGIEKGDVVLEVNRQPVETFDQAKSAIEKAGDNASLLLISRGGRTIYVTVQPS